MNTRILLFLFIASASTAWAQQPVFLNYSPAGFTDILVTPENDLIAVGRSFSDDRIELWKINANGVEIWHKTLPFNGNVITMDKINTTNDHNYIISGRFIQTPDSTKLAFIKFSPDGEIIWASYPKVLKSVEVDDVFQLADNSFVMTGTSGSYGTPYYSLYHFDSTASNLWSFTHYLVENDTFILNWQSAKCSFKSDNGEHLIAICADNASGSAINADSYVMKFSTTGQLVWKTKMDYGQTDKANSGIALKDGSIVVCGLTNQVFSNPSARAFVTKLNEDGDVLWENFFDSTAIGAPLSAVDLLELKNGDLLITGNKIGAPKYNIFLLLLDSAGNEKNRLVLWRNNHDDYPAAIVELENNMISIAGKQGLPSFKNLLVLFPLSIITVTRDLFIDSPLFEVFPNPVETQLTLHYEQMKPSNLGLDIFSNSGVKVFSGSPSTKIDLSLYPVGMYYFILSDSQTSKSFVRKVIKVK